MTKIDSARVTKHSQSQNTEKISKSNSGNAIDDVAAGAFAGLVARCLTAPLDVIKIRFQLQSSSNAKYTNMIQGFRSVIKEEGFSSLWKGNLSATFLWISYAMIQFSIYGVLKRFGESIPDPFASINISRSSSSSRSNNGQLFSGNSKMSSLHNQDKKSTIQNQSKSTGRLWNTIVLFLAGAAAGMTATAITYPLDIMRTQFALQGREKAFLTINSFISHTVKTKGIKGFFAGATPAIVGITPYMGLNFAIYESLKRIGANTDSKAAVSSTASSGYTLDSVLKVARVYACGAVAGGTSKLLVYPLDTIKKRLQAQVLSNKLYSCVSSINAVNNNLSKGPVLYTGMIDCFRTTIANEGIAGLYRGIIPTTVKSVVATAVTFAAYEYAKESLQHLRNGDIK